MAYALKTFEEVRAAIIADYQNRFGTDLDVSPGSDAWIKANVLAGQVTGLYQHQDSVRRQAFLLYADLEHLLIHGAARGKSRLAATISEDGVVRIRADTAVRTYPADMEMVHVDGTRFKTLAGGTTSLGPDGEGYFYQDQICESVDATEDANKEAADVLTISSPPTGVLPESVIQTGFVGGTNIEEREHYRQRLLDHDREPPRSGSEGDYRQWAMSIDGITNAVEKRHRRGLGTVDLFLLSDGSSERKASAAQIAAVTALINTNRPLTVYDHLEVTHDSVKQATDITATPIAGSEYEWDDDWYTGVGNHTCDTGCTVNTIELKGAATTSGMVADMRVVINEEQVRILQVVDTDTFTVTPDLSAAPAEDDNVLPGGGIWQECYDAVVAFYLSLLPLDTLYKANLLAAVLSLAHVMTGSITTPAGDVTAVDDIVTPGNPELIIPGATAPTDVIIIRPS